MAIADRILVIGFGNPGRRDDGLGPALAEVIERLCLPGVTVEANYQLTVEDAALIAEHDVVIFADAAVTGDEPYAFSTVEAERSVSFTTHHVSPGAVLGLAHDLFGAAARGYLLAIRGYEFNVFDEGLSLCAAANLTRAVEFLATIIRTRRLFEVDDQQYGVSQPCASEECILKG